MFNWGPKSIQLGAEFRVLVQIVFQSGVSPGELPIAPTHAVTHQHSERDQIAFLKSLICTAAHRNPAN